MADLITLNCPTCGGNLQVTNDVERFVCAHCGNTHIVDPGVRVESLAAEVEKLRIESEIRRLRQELQVLAQKRDQLLARVQSYRDRTASELAAYRVAGNLAYLMAAATAFGVLTVGNNRNSDVLVIGGVIVFVLLIAIGRSTKRLAIEFHADTPDGTIEGIAALQRQITDKQQELDGLQRYAEQLTIHPDRAIIGDAQYVLHNAGA
jgi:hypothetical protein